MKKIFLLMSILALFGITTLKAQVTIGKLVKPDSSAVLQVISPDSTRGVLVPEMTELQRSKIKNPADGLLIYNITEDCYNYWNKADSLWQSICGAMGKSLFLLVCDSGVVVNGTYGSGVAMNTSNYIKIFVNVKKIGSYSIQAAARPDNGYFFETSGTFYTTGGFYITIPATGQPKNPTAGDHFTLTSSSGTDSCKFDVPVIDTSIKPMFDIACGSIQVQGAYFEDSVLTSKPNPIFDNNPNQIAVQLTNIPTTSFGAVASLQTDTVNGISFKWTGILTSSPQTVYMQGTGIPRGLNDKVMTITSNSLSNPGSCSATVLMLIPRKRLMTFGHYDYYGYNAGQVDYYGNPNTFNTMLTDKNNFGYNQWSIVRFAGFNNKAGAPSATSSPNDVTDLQTWVDNDDRDIIAINDPITTTCWRNLSAATLHNYLFGIGHRKIDIFIMGYCGSAGTPTNATWFRNNDTGDLQRCQELVNFCRSGGILIIASEEGQSNQNFMNLMFGNPSPAITTDTKPGNGPGTNYMIGFNYFNADLSLRPNYCLDSDPILQGPFGTIVGRNWGEDASQTVYYQNLPLDSIIIYSGARGATQSPSGTNIPPADGVTIFRHTLYPFLFIGDGGFWSARTRTAANQSAADNICPFVLTSTTKNGRTYPNYPYYRSNMGVANSRVDNTIFIANAFAWAIYQAEDYRRAHK